MKWRSSFFQDLKEYISKAGEVTFADAHKRRQGEGCVFPSCCLRGFVHIVLSNRVVHEKIWLRQKTVYHLWSPWVSCTFFLKIRVWLIYGNILCGLLKVLINIHTKHLKMSLNKHTANWQHIVDHFLFHEWMCLTFQLAWNFNFMEHFKVLILKENCIENLNFLITNLEGKRYGKWHFAIWRLNW